MTKQMLMGNEAMGLAALAAGVNVVCGYPGTPSSEVVETVARNNPGYVHVEWSINEKAALELAAGASMSGTRSLVTMKQVGLNVASDPLMTLAYLGVTGGLVVLVADDPGPISSQTEQDTRTFASFAKVLVLDPSSPEEAYSMMMDAFELSERYGEPVILRPTTRVCHGCASMEVDPPADHGVSGFVKDPRWVVFPRTSYLNHKRLNALLPQMAEDLCAYPSNVVYHVECGYNGRGEYAVDSIKVPRRRGIATGGISDAYAAEVASEIAEDYTLLHIATPFPFPEELAVGFLEGLDEVLVLEELDPVIERALLQAAGKHHIDVDIKGKLTGDANDAGENSVESVRTDLYRFFHLELPERESFDDAPKPPVRPPVLCAGCPHRGAFYAVKQALKGRKAVYSGDIGCYTLGNAAPLDMVDTCLCMGAGITQAQGIHVAEPDCANIAFIGDSTFFASGITGMVNAFYNQHDITLCVLDNSTTAMTGQQPHPGTGVTMMGDVTEKVSIDAMLRAMGLAVVEHADPLDLETSIAAVSKAVEFEGPSAVIFESPCIALFKRDSIASIDYGKCTTCRRCITQLGCPGLTYADGRVSVDESLCYGCNLCAEVCTFGALSMETIR